MSRLYIAGLGAMQVGRIVCGVVLAMLGMHAAAAACLQANDTDGQLAQGRLISVRITDEAYNRTEQAYILQLKEPACLEGTDDYDKIEKTNRIHVFSLETPLINRLRRLVGKNVVVHGNPFGERTAHHHAPIVMRISKIDPL
jgi:hypothetical protein